MPWRDSPRREGIEATKMSSAGRTSPMRGYPRNRLTDRSGADPVITKTTQSRGHTISFEDAGQGPAVVLVPGWTMSAADRPDAGYIDRLATSHRVLSVGGNDRPEEERKTSDALGVELQVLPDLDHLQAFSRLDVVMPLVLGFLDRLGLRQAPPASGSGGSRAWPAGLPLTSR
jgi:hypothetical protein